MAKEVIFARRLRKEYARRGGGDGDDDGNVTAGGSSGVAGDRVVAVSNFSLRLFRDQITALLGHNGAGKSTTMSMLTGLVRPTKGRCTIAGKRIDTEMDAIRRDVGRWCECFCDVHSCFLL
jgi:ABC-type multidrug transport system ATPase subunit